MDWLRSPTTPDGWVVPHNVKKIVESYWGSWYHDSPISKAILLWGPSGCGKTCMPYAFEEQLNLHVIKYNMSVVKKFDDMRHHTQVEENIEGKWNVILLDECDNVKKWDKLKDIISITKIPIILTANTMKKIPKHDDVIELHLDYPSATQKARVLERINERENLQISIENINKIAEVCKTTRGAIISFQKCVINKTFKKIDRPYEDLGVEDKILEIHQGKGQHNDVEVGEFIRYALANRVDPNDIANIKELEMMGREVSLGDMPKYYMNLCRSNTKVLKRPPYRGYKKSFIYKDRRGKKDEAIEFKPNKDKVVKKKIMLKTTVEDLW